MRSDANCRASSCAHKSKTEIGIVIASIASQEASAGMDCAHAKAQSSGIAASEAMQDARMARGAYRAKRRPMDDPALQIQSQPHIISHPTLRDAETTNSAQGAKVRARMGSLTVGNAERHGALLDQPVAHCEGTFD